MPVIFVTDALIFILVFMVICFMLYARTQESFRVPWRQIIKQPMAMSAVVILIVYVTIGLLDSIHFRPKLENINHSENQYSNEILSVLDVVLKNIRTQNERTYSAPLATHAYAKELIELESGKSFRDYPRLKYGGAHLENINEEYVWDVILKIILGLLIGKIIACIFLFLLSAYLAKKANLSTKQFLCSVYKRETYVPWHVIYLTVITLGSIMGIIAFLSQGYHVFGTDKVGQDVLYQALKSIRTGLMIGTLTTLIMLPFAILMGLMAGYFRGWVDDVIQYMYTTLNSIPSVLLIASSILLLQVYIANNQDKFTSLEQIADMRLLFLCAILGLTSWTSLCRLLRGEAMKLRQVEYVEAAKAFGVSSLSIIIRHLLPNVMHIVIITTILGFSGLVLAEAVLSYIGVGVDPTTQSWGNMINNARLEMAREPIVWWSLLAAFIFMFVLVLAANLFSDAVRDAFDPRIRGQE